MISVEEAQARITGALTPTPAETVFVTEALGRVLAEAVVARVTQPSANVSAMDGYALRFEEGRRLFTPRLRVLGTVAAGQSFRGTVAPGEAVRIFTGAPLPAGANTVIMQEDVVQEGDHVRIPAEGIKPGQHVRMAGLDFRSGQILLPAGRRLTARDMALAAAGNVSWLRVRRPPRVAVLATGDEVVLPGEPMGAAQIISSNSVALMGLLRAWGAVPVHLGVARDTPGALAAAASAAAGCDLLLTSGGVSVGDFDLVRQLAGAVPEFWKVAIRPGKPLLFGRCQDVPLLGLPGNPVSAYICALVFLLPALAALSGESAFAPLRLRARAGAALRANDQRQTYLRASLGQDARGDLLVTPFPQQDTALVSVLAAAQALIVRPPHAPAVAADDQVDVMPFPVLPHGA